MTERSLIAPTIVVIGAGVTGLTVAHALRRAGQPVVLIERRARAGGVIDSIEDAGFLVEAGPNALLLDDPALLSFLDELGLSGEMLEASPLAKNRFIVRAGRLVAAPNSPSSFVKTPLLSSLGKLRLLGEPWLPRVARDVEESVADFICRRLGREVLDYVVDPLVGGVHAGDPRLLSMRYAFPKLHGAERERGSLALGGVAALLRKRRTGQPRFKARSVSFRTGLSALTRALAESVGDALWTDTQIEAIRPQSGVGFRLRVQRAGHAPCEIRADTLVVATPAHAAAALPFSAETGVSLSELEAVEYPPLVSVALGVSDPKLGRVLDGFGFLVPSCEPGYVLGTLFTSAVFPGRAPPGFALLTSYVGGARQPELSRLSDSALVDLVLSDLRRLLGVEGMPAFARVTRHARSIPQYNLGFERVLSLLDLAEQRAPGLFIGGPLRGGASVGDCIRAGLGLAKRALSAPRAGG